MISVIIPIYNAESYLHRCVDSILSQSYTDLELLLINDGSTDRCANICDEYLSQDSRIRVFHKKNGGVSSARNLGLDYARGEYIAFCDADDYVGKDWLMEFHDAIENNMDLVIQGIFYITNNGEIESQKISCYTGYTNEEKQNLIVQLMLKGYYGYPVTKLFRRQIIEENHIRFDEQSTFREDEQFFSKYLEYAETFRCIDKENYYYVMPSLDKRYTGDERHSLLPIFQSLDVIFDRQLPIEICRIHYVNIKDCATQYILQGKKLTLYHLDLYRRMVTTLCYTKGLKNRLLNFLILQSHACPLLSKYTLGLVHKLKGK